MTFYTGAAVSPTFMRRWRTKKHIGAAAPWCRVRVRRGRLIRSLHYDWPNPQFGKIVGLPMSPQWYADWTPLDDWTEVEGVRKIDLDQSFDKNGICVATIDVDNLTWADQFGPFGNPYHQRQRGVYWPWRGWVPPNRPGSGDTKNEWYTRLPNSQILIEQGYGSDTAVKTFTGLIDAFNEKVRPDVISVTSRDFGGVLTDTHVFGVNKDPRILDPITFVPDDYWRISHLDPSKAHRWIRIKDATDIVRCCLRWVGFKEWEIEDSGVNLNVPYTVDKSKTMMDVINAVKEQLGYVFFIGEPTGEDKSIGVPVFRRASVLVSQRSQPIALDDNDMLTDLQPQHDNKDDKYIIRVRGVVNNKIGATLWGDTVKRVQFQYWPPWISRMAGVVKQLTYYNVGDGASLGFKTEQEVVVACVLIAVQIALTRDTGIAQTPGQPAFGLDSFAFVTDAGTGIASRLYISNRKSSMTRGGEGSSELLWATEIGGSLCDNPEFAHIVNDYNIAISGGKVLSWSPAGWSTK